MINDQTLHLPDPGKWSTDYDRLIELMEQGKRVVTVWESRYGERMGQALCHSVEHRSSWEVCGVRVIRDNVAYTCNGHNLRFMDDADKVQLCTDDEADKGLLELFGQGASREDCMHFLKNRNFSEAKIYALLKPYFPF